MKSVPIRVARARFAALVAAAEAGWPTVITRNGKPVAALVPPADAAKIYPYDRPSLGAFLLTFPGGAAFERSADRMRDVEL